MADAVRQSFDAELAPGLYAVYADEYEALPASYPDFFNVEDTERAYEEIDVTTGLGTTPVKPESQDVAMDIPLRVGGVRLNITTYGLGYGVSKELGDDDLYRVVGEPASRFLAQSGRDTEERMAWAMLNGSFTTTQAYDQVSIVNTAHPLRGGGTYSNKAAGDTSLGITALQASLERHQLMVNERGLKIKQVPDKLVIPVQLQWLAHEILDSSQKPFTSDNTTNVLSSGKIGLSPVMSPFLTSTTAWWTAVTQGKSKHKLCFFWREKPNFDHDYDKSARVASFYNFFRFGTVAWDWRGLDGSTG